MLWSVAVDYMTFSHFRLQKALLCNLWERFGASEGRFSKTEKNTQLFLYLKLNKTIWKDLRRDLNLKSDLIKCSTNSWVLSIAQDNRPLFTSLTLYSVWVCTDLFCCCMHVLYRDECNDVNIKYCHFFLLVNLQMLLKVLEYSLITVSINDKEGGVALNS